jgi:hypothetical protein
MADNYLQFSESLDSLTPEETAWLRAQLDNSPDTDCPRFLLDYPEREEGDDYCGFDYEFRDGNDGHDLCIYAEDSGDLGRVAHLVQRFLKQFHPDQCWPLTYANTCSKPRGGEFGGGAVFVTADEIRWNDSGDFVEEQRKVFNRRQQHDLRLIRKAEELGIEPDLLDEAVHDAADSAAASINNAGVEDQITYLVEQFGAEAVEEILDGPPHADEAEDGQDQASDAT